MIDAYFKSSDKIREYSSKVFLLSILTIFFEFYQVKIEKIPFIDVPYPNVEQTVGYVPTLSLLLFLGACYFFFVLLGLLIGEYAEYDEKTLIQLIARAKAGELTSGIGDTEPDVQKVLSGLLKARENNVTIARFGIFLRLTTDFVLPAIVLGIAGYFERDSAVALIGRLMHFR